MPEVIFASIVLNEAEFIRYNLQQHYEFCDRWVIVEGAVKGYPTDRVTAEGLSTDATARIIRDFPDPDHKLQFVRHGWAANKEELRSVYADKFPPQAGTVVVFDADEFLRKADLRKLLLLMQPVTGPAAWRIPHIHFWKQPTQIITGGYFDVPHDRIYHWTHGCRYVRNHNHPETPQGKLLQELNHFINQRVLHSDGRTATHPDPCWFHYGFMKAAENIADKNQYYLSRGEADSRPRTTRDRAAWFEAATPTDCKLLEWKGGHPEIFEGVFP